MDSSLVSLEKSLELVRRAFEEERDRISRGRSELQKEKEEWEGLASRLALAQPSHVIRLNVGGTVFMTSPSTLTSVKGRYNS